MTPLEKHINHENFIKFEEKGDIFVITMKSYIMSALGTGKFFTDISGSRIVPEETYEVFFQKDIKFINNDKGTEDSKLSES